MFTNRSYLIALVRAVLTLDPPKPKKSTRKILVLRSYQKH